MKVTIGNGIQCECGTWVMIKANVPHPLLPREWMECINIDCKYYGKRFALPVVEVEELP